MWNTSIELLRPQFCKCSCKYKITARILFCGDYLHLQSCCKFCVDVWWWSAWWWYVCRFFVIALVYPGIVYSWPAYLYFCMFLVYVLTKVCLILKRVAPSCIIKYGALWCLIAPHAKIMCHMRNNCSRLPIIWHSDREDGSITWKQKIQYVLVCVFTQQFTFFFISLMFNLFLCAVGFL